MAGQQTLDSSTHQSDDLSQSRSSSPSSSDPSLSRNLSSSRLNAEAPEFVPGRSTPPLPLPQQAMMIPPPPPPAMLHMFHRPPPFLVPIHGPVPMPPPPRMVPVQNHHPNHLPHHTTHHQNRHVNQQFFPVRNHDRHDYQQRGGGGDQDADLIVKRGDHDRRKDYKNGSKKDHAEDGAPVAIDPKSGLPEDIVQKIVNQVEYYFSDMNLATTDHLIRFINKDPQGYVPISVVASFKKIKALISSHSQLATILGRSSNLVLSEDESKVRRQHPITDHAIEELQARIVVVENLPEDHCYQNLMKTFSAIGSVKNIRNCQPQYSGNGAQSAASRSTKRDGAILTNKFHAFVEYETVELAEKAVSELNKDGNWKRGLRVRLLLNHQTKEQKHSQRRGRKGHEEEEKQSEEHLGELDADLQERIVIGEEDGKEKGGGQGKGRNRGRGKGRGRGQANHHHYHNNGRGNHHHAGTPLSNNGEQAGMAMGKQQPPGPRMPDGTRGFSMGRGKPVTINA